MSAGVSSLPARAQNQGQSSIQEVVVTGTRIRTTDQGALPVQTITYEQIEQSGAVSSEQFLQTISVAVRGNSFAPAN